MSTKTHSTLESVSMSKPWRNASNLSSFHSAYNNLGCNVRELRQKAEELGLKPSSNFDKIASRPDATFTKIVKELHAERRPTEQERLAVNHIDNFGRYKKLPPTEAGECANQELKALQSFQRGDIGREALKGMINSTKLKEIQKSLGYLPDGDFGKVASKILLNNEERATKLEGPQNSFQDTKKYQVDQKLGILSCLTDSNW